MLDYRHALRTIFQRADFERQPQPPYGERVYRLARMSELLEALGNPQQAYRSVHIAGTKGKGSTTAMIESILRHAGYHTGMYTSPHLHTFRERIQSDGQLIPEAEVTRLMERLAPILEARPEVTVFEAITALAMLYYAERGVDFGVFEVGLGGRLDATNVLKPLVSVITSISLDHTQVLGDTLAAIAGEKGGIIKPGVPVVASPQRPEALAVLRALAAERQAPLTLVGEAWQWRWHGAEARGQMLDIYRAGNAATPDYAALALPLLGEHQLENAATAVATVETLRAQGVVLLPEAVRAGLAEVQWPGRLEILGQHPLVVVDGAHNVDSTQRLLEAVRRHLRYRRLLLVFGAGTTHNAHEFLAVLLSATSRAWMTRSRHAKATPVAELQTQAATLGHTAAGTETVAEALAAALAEAGAEDLVLVTGSLFVVAEAREAWAAMHNWPAYPADPPGVY